jgi:hypothetical protein
MIKKLISALLVLIFALSLLGCTGPNLSGTSGGSNITNQEQEDNNENAQNENEGGEAEQED